MNIKIRFLDTMVLIILLYGGMSRPAIGQTYEQVFVDIVQFEQVIPRNYAVETTGVELDGIIKGIIRNNSDYYSEGLTRRLVGYSSAAKILDQAKVAESPAEGDLLKLLFYTKQGAVPVFITDVALRNRVGKTGALIKRTELEFWKKAAINNSNVIEALEGFSPATAAVLVDAVSRPWYQAGARVYANINTSWASQSLWGIYYSVREVELAKRSVVVKLLAEQGYITIPKIVYADFEFSGWPSIPIYLDPVTWNEGDISGLVRLLSNPYYSAAAQAELTTLNQ